MMITVNHLIIPAMARVASKAKMIAQRWVRALMDARMRKIQHEIEFHRRLHSYRRLHDMPALTHEDRLGRP